jgi:hypothetical protein
MRRALVHRYDNQPDILAVEEKGYSDVYRRARGGFDMVIVVPTGKARTEVAVFADATSEQYTPMMGDEPWPGRPDAYPIRVDLTNVRYTTRDQVRAAIEAAGESWIGQWTVRIFNVEEKILSRTSDLPPAVRERRRRYGFAFPEELLTGDKFPEGASRQVLVNTYERSAAARKQCIDHYGVVCTACGIDFRTAYGEEAAGFIHVHHLRALSEVNASYEVDPVADLRPVCPNCHAVIHLRTPPYKLEEVVDLLRNAPGA